MKRMATLSLRNRSLNAHIFYPSDFADKDSPRPGVIFLPDLIGVVDSLLESARLMAVNLDMVAIVPDLYSDMGGPRYCTRQFFEAACRNNEDANNPALDEIHDLVDAVKNRPEVDGDRLGLIGQCLTGGFALHMALRPEIKAPVVYHHSLGLKGSGMPASCSRKIDKTVQGHYVYLDPACPPGRVKQLAEEMGDHLDYDYYSFLPHGIPHFFRMHPEGKRSWNNLLNFLRAQLA